MDELDRKILEAWDRKCAALRGRGGVAGFELPRPGGATYTRPLRSFALVLRASDSRLLSEEAATAMHSYDEQGDVAVDAIEAAGDMVMWARVDVRVMRTCCTPVTILWPGVSIQEAARLLGVNPTTVRTWIRKGVLQYQRDINRADRKRDDQRVWTAGPVDPNGRIWQAEWGSMTTMLLDRIEATFEQWIVLRMRQLSVRTTVRQWRCPRCERWVYKVFLPMHPWTLRHHIGMIDHRVGLRGRQRDFACHRCSRLLYESSERTSKPGGKRQPQRRVNVRHRFIHRLTDGLLRGDEVEGWGSEE